MNQKIGIWIDHKRAVIVSACGEHVATVESEIRPHAPDGGNEKHGEQRYEQHLDRYFDEVISRLVHPEALLILGPGEAKLQLKERLTRSTGLSGCVVGIETAGKLTDPQFAAKVMAYYRIDR